MPERRLVVDTSTFINLGRTNNLNTLNLSGRTVWIPDVVQQELQFRVNNSSSVTERAAAQAALDWIAQEKVTHTSSRTPPAWGDQTQRRTRLQ
jgi:predicted nucleic acid-binding protein